MSPNGSGVKNNPWLILTGVVILVLFCSAYLATFNDSLSGGMDSVTNSFSTLASRLALPAFQWRPHETTLLRSISERCQIDFKVWNESAVLECAARTGHAHELYQLGLATPTPKVAFLFITRDHMPHEPLWRRFFQGHKGQYSIYVHATPGYHYPPESFFYNHEIPSAVVERYSINLVDAMRRLLAYSILDPFHGSSNSWFVYACEATIPLRSFPYTYHFLMDSQQSFVESFRPHTNYVKWETMPEFPKKSLRKGELWMAMQRRHAVVVLEDSILYQKFKANCFLWCASDEQYIQTLLGLVDPMGISTWPIMYVNWSKPHWTSPHALNSDQLTQAWFHDIQERSVQVDGAYHDTSFEAQFSKTRTASQVCMYNQKRKVPCYLFARKVNASAIGYLESLPSSVLGY